MYNILVVDDSTVARSVIRRTIRIVDASVDEIYEAEDGEDALSILYSEDIHAVFADINMPRMNGIEMVREMAATALLATTPVALVTTEHSANRIESLKAMGVATYLVKPFSPEKLRDALATLRRASRIKRRPERCEAVYE